MKRTLRHWGSGRAGGRAKSRLVWEELCFASLVSDIPPRYPGRAKRELEIGAWGSRDSSGVERGVWDSPAYHCLGRKDEAI